MKSYTEQQVIHKSSASWPESMAKIIITLSNEPHDDRDDGYAVHVRRFKGIREIGGSSNYFIDLPEAVRFYKKKVLETLPTN